MKNWLSDALEASLFTAEEEPNEKDRKSIVLAQKTIQERGIKRFMKQILSLSGQVVFNGQKVVGIILNPLYPLINRIKTAFEVFLKAYKIRVSLDEI